MLKTYRIIPLVFILFLFGFTLSTVAPVFAQSTQELESRINELERVLCHLHPEEPPSFCDEAYNEKVHSLDKRAQESLARGLEQAKRDQEEIARQESLLLSLGPWDKSMGMRHPARPCMDRSRVPGGCGQDTRSPAQIKSDPYDTQNPLSQGAQ